MTNEKMVEIAMQAMANHAVHVCAERGAPWLHALVDVWQAIEGVAVEAGIEFDREFVRKQWEKAAKFQNEGVRLDLPPREVKVVKG